MKSDVAKVRFDTLVQATAVAGDCYSEGKYEDSLMSLEEALEEIEILIQHLETLQP